MRKEKIKRSIEFLEYILPMAKTPEDKEYYIIQLFELNKLLNSEP